MPEMKDKASMSFFERLSQRKFYKYPFLNKKLQFTFSLMLSAISIGNVLYICLLFYFYAQEIFERFSVYLPSHIKIESIVWSQTRLFILTILFIIAFEFFLLTLWGLFFSHRIAGPLYAIGQKLKEVANGTTPDPVTLRKTALVHSFAQDVNSMISRLKKQEEKVQKALKEVQLGNSSTCESILKELTN